jgi:lipopolysaccharide export system protein LptA
VRVEASFAEFSRRDQSVRFEGGVKAVRGLTAGAAVTDIEGGETPAATGETIQADTGLARLGGDEGGADRLELVELRGRARIDGGRRAAGAFQEMEGDAIDLQYRADGRTLERALVSGAAALRVAAAAGGEGRRIRAATIEVHLAPDGVTPTGLTAREAVEARFPGEDGTTRIVRAAALDATGDTRQGLTGARFSGGVEFREERQGTDRTAASNTLEAALTPGFEAIREATFGGGVRFTDGTTVATASSGRYRLDEGMLVLAGLRNELPPNVRTDRLSIDGARIDVTLAGPRIEASGAVRTALTPSPRSASAGGDAGAAKVPSMLRADQPVNVAADRLIYDGAASTATYSGDAQLWQAETTIKADTIVMNEASGDLSARGAPKAPVSTTAVLMEPGDRRSGAPRERTVASAAAREFAYEEAARRATYIGDAFVSGPQGDLRGDRIELFLLPSGDELERAEAYGSVTLVQSTSRRASGARLTYFAAEERYVMTGAPVTIVDECGRETTGGTLTFFRTADRVVVDGGPVRSRTRGGKGCQ